MKLIVDISVLIDDKASLQLMYGSKVSNHSSSKRRAPYHHLQYTNCFSQSPWQGHGKYLYRLLTSFVKSSSDFILYCKCPKQYSTWMKRERSLWCQHEFGHNLHPLLLCDSKKELREYVKTNCILVSCNENLVRYWMQYSSSCVFYSLSTPPEERIRGLQSLAFVSKREELIAHCRQMQALDDENGDENNTTSSGNSKVDGYCTGKRGGSGGGDNDGEDDGEDDSEGSGDENAGEDVYIATKDSDNDEDKRDVDTGEPNNKNNSRSNVMCDIGSSHDGDADDDVVDDEAEGSYESFCLIHAESLCIMRNLALLCQGYMSECSGSRALARCSLPVYCCDDSADMISAGGSREQRSSDSLHFLGFQSSVFCQQIDLHVFSTQLQVKQGVQASKTGTAGVDTAVSRAPRATWQHGGAVQCTAVLGRGVCLRGLLCTGPHPLPAAGSHGRYTL